MTVVNKQDVMCLLEDMKKEINEYLDEIPKILDGDMRYFADEIPSFNPQSENRAKWVDRGGFDVCSRCGDERSGCVSNNYCPNCGALMA